MENKVSILMPVKNGSFYLSAILSSIQRNVRANDQIVIIDDGSDDGSDIILKSWLKKLDNLTVITTKGVGLVKALNLGLANCENNWIARFDVDDEYSDERINEQVKFIKPETVGIFSDYSFMDETGKNYGFMSSPVYAEPVSISLANSTRTAHPVVMFNKNAVIDCGSYQESDFPAEDLSLWLRLSKIGNLTSVPETLLRYRIRKGSITNEKRNLVLKKKREVIDFYGLDRHNVEYCNSEFENILNSYALTNNFVNRKILFIRDLIAANRTVSLNHSISVRLISCLAKELLSQDGRKELKLISKDRKSRIKLRNTLTQS